MAAAGEVRDAPIILRARKQGAAMARDDAIVALCERSPVAFLRDFLANQPRVKHVPAITVRYRESPA